MVNLVAHDLKNPLTSVLFASDILIHEGTRPERIPRYLEMIHESAHDALGYIKRYLEAQADSVLSRQQAGSGDVAAPLPEVLAWLSRRYRSEERRVGKECGSTCSSLWSPVT